MDYPSYEICWRCYNLKCPLLSIHGIHSSALVGCLEHKQFCTYFNVPFQVLYASDQKKKTQSSTSEHKINLKKPSVVNTTQDEDEKGLPDLIVYYSDDEVEDKNEENGSFYESRHFSSKQPPSQPRKTAKINISESKQSQSQTKVQTLSAPKLSKTKKTTFVATTKVHPDTQQLQPKHAQRNISRCCECHGVGGKSKCVQNCPCKKNGVQCFSCFPKEQGNC